MGEKLIDKKEHKEYELEIYWGRPLEFERYDRDICSVYVKLKIEEGIVFIEQTHISHEAEIMVENLIKIGFPKVENWEEFLKEKLIDYTFGKARDRIDSGKYQKGEPYPEMITTQKIKQWLDKIKLLYED